MGNRVFSFKKSEIQYEKDVTVSVWPSEAYSEVLNLEVGFNFKDPSQIPPNYLRADVYFETLAVRTEKEKKKYTVLKFIYFSKL